MNVKKAIIVFAAIIIYAIPITCIIVLSEREIEKYRLDIDFDTKESAYGRVYQVERKDVEEYYECDVNVTCIEKKEVIVPNTYKIKVQEEDEIFKKTILASDGKSNILAEFNGKVCGIDYNDNNIVLSYYDFADKVYECHAPEDIKNVFDEAVLYNKDKEKISVVRKSNINSEGKYMIYLSMPKSEKYDYGTSIPKYRIYTGNVYKKSLVINENCIFKGEDGYYVRKVDENGAYLSDIKVEIGYRRDGYVCISGVEEGMLCDGGTESGNDEEKTSEEQVLEEDS
ncbi:MAG: hypothetical protein K6G64_08725 [Eubacterium sp.]|nr:hypothetical protein [Eubacterium sp.]